MSQIHKLIDVIEHYFEMSKFDAERALNIYKTFGKQTNQVVEYLSKARAYENSTRLEIPKLKHAPTSLTGSLEEYLQDPDFEINRRQYLAQQEAKKGRKNMSNGNAESSDYSKNSNTAKKTETREGGQTLRFSDIGPPTPAKSEPKGPAPDLIDLFDSIEQNQQPMATQPQQVSNFQQVHQYYQLQQPQQPPPSTYPQPQDLYGQNSQLQQQTGGSLGNVAGNTFGQPQSQTQTLPQPSQPNFTGAGIGGYPQQSFGHQQNLPSNHQQPSLSEFSNQQSQFGGVSQQAQNSTDFAHQQSPFAASVQRQPTNPFRQSVMPQSPSQISQFTAAAAAPPLPTSHPYQSTNPFARTLTSQPPALQTQSPFVFSPSSQPQSGQQQPQPLQPNPGGTNPFGFSSSQPQPPPQPPQLSPQQAQPLKSTPTGTNPFARNLTAPQQAVRPITPTQTGSTNPFRQSTFGPGWYAPQPSMGSLDHIETVPVFPRPGQQSAGQAPTQRQGWS